ncbi:MAG: adenylate/guanylate cyclase domain-containing protein [Hyphomicrobiales bacterium]
MIRRLRIATGLVLFAFVSCHLINHALGLVSLDALERGRAILLGPWHNPVGSTLLYGALAVHLGLAVWAVYERRTWRLRPIDWLQLISGLVIPIYLTPHILNTNLAGDLYDFEPTYRFELLLFFVIAPGLAINQTILVLLAWGHGVIGIHQWFRLKPWFAHVRAYAFAFALLVPALSLAGVWVAGRDVAVLAQDEAWSKAVIAEANWMSQAEIAVLTLIQRVFIWTLVAAVVIALVWRWIATSRSRRARVVRIGYPGERSFSVAPGTSILEASQQNGVPHAAVCGGRGRCSTCRVRIAQGLTELPEPSPQEIKVLAKVGASPNIRLACQTRPVAECEVIPLLPPALRSVPGAEAGDAEHGQERVIVVLFADLRGFTSLSEEMLPYDVVFLLNRYFTVMGEAIEQAGGYLDKFIGDGIMAWFDLEGGREASSLAALKAARGMGAALAELNHDLAGDLGKSLRMGVGIHLGPAVVGKMGYGTALALTAVGDTVNTASRLEALTKEFGVELVLSDRVRRAAGMKDGLFETRQMEIRGREKPLNLVLVNEAAELELDAA